MTYILLLLIALVASVTARSKELSMAEGQWVQFKREYARTYTGAEEAHRFAIFRKNLRVIDDLNRRYNPRTTFGITGFTDMTHKEQQAHINTPALLHKKPHKPAHPSKVNLSIPVEVDWRKEGAVTPIINQGQCGSSPYFAAVVSMEGAWKIKGNDLVALSQQQVLDCSSAEGNQGCNGGEMTYSFQYVIDVGGIQSEASYPYQNGNQFKCLFDKSKVVAKFSSYKELPGDEASFTQALTIGPVATAVNAQDQGFYYYKTGVFNSTTCSEPPPNHGIAVVGYGVTKTGDQYYILKNSWGVNWGMQGYMLLARNAGNMCGIASQGTYVVV